MTAYHRRFSYFAAALMVMLGILSFVDTRAASAAPGDDDFANAITINPASLPFRVSEFGTTFAAGMVTLNVQRIIIAPSGVTYFQGGAVFCLRGSGPLIWLAASGIPRHPEIIGSYTVPDFPGFTCATLFEPGTLVLVTQNPQ